MGTSKAPFTMKDLAAAAHVSQSTVSLALRNDPRLRPETVRRIKELAEKHNYHPDPALSALVAYRARTRPRRDYGKIAILHDQTDQIFNFSLRQQIRGIQAQAQSLGYDAEPFLVAPDKAQSMRLGHILYSRGIRGLILLALRMPGLEMQWDHFSAVVIGEYFSSPQLNHVNNHHSAVLSVTYRELRKLGYRKIGFCNSLISEERKHYLYLASYLKCLYLDGIDAAKSPPLLYDANADWSPLPWLDRGKFDAVMCMVPPAFVEKLSGSKYQSPDRLGIAGYAIPANDPESPYSGCVIDYERMGASAVDLLQSMLLQGHRGVPAENEHFDFLIRGQWVNRRTTPGRSRR